MSPLCVAPPVPPRDPEWLSATPPHKLLGLLSPTTPHRRQLPSLVLLRPPPNLSVGRALAVFLRTRVRLLINFNPHPYDLPLVLRTLVLLPPLGNNASAASPVLRLLSNVSNASNASNAMTATASASDELNTASPTQELDTVSPAHSNASSATLIGASPSKGGFFFSVEGRSTVNIHIRQSFHR